MTALVWFRTDLRLTDNPALHAALAENSSVILLYLHDTAQTPALGSASKWWLKHSLHALEKDIAAQGGQLSFAIGDAQKLLPQLVQQHGIKKIYWNRQYDPYAIGRDTQLKKSFSKQGIEVQTFNSTLLHEPWEITTKEGAPCKVFTPFWKNCLAKGAPAKPLEKPKHIKTLAVKGNSLNELNLYPLPHQPDWARNFHTHWHVGEEGAWRTLLYFFKNGLAGYKEKRNRPDLAHTSRLSPHMRWGEISPRQIWWALQAYAATHELPAEDINNFLSEIGWREFSYHLLYHHPHMQTVPLQEKFNHFPWATDYAQNLRAWQQGNTGVPLVDAGMRELWHTGTMHNRVRMVAASFLVKNLLIPWQEGEKWFWDTLLDADPANNPASWQWVAGCGADAAPYFRIFNPLLQAEKFDPNGSYRAKWLSPADLARKPIIDFSQSRTAALNALAAIRK